MQIADFVTEVPTPGPHLRQRACSITMHDIGDADRQGGVETLVTDGRRTRRVRRDTLAAAPEGLPFVLDQDATPTSQGECAVARDGRKPATRDDEGLTETFRTLSPWLQRKLAHRLGSSRADVDDLVQESFVRLGRYAPEDRARHPRALLWKIAGNVARDAFRREAVRQHGQHVPLDDAVAQLAQGPEQHARAALKQAILALPLPLRDVFLLARFTPMTNADIAKHLDISVKTVEWRLAKAITFCLERVSE